MLTGRLITRAILLAIAAMLLGVLVTILWVAFYSAVLAPGEGLAFYEDYATRAAPMVSIIAGIPILFGAGWLAAGGLAQGEGARAGALVGIAYTVIDAVLLLALAGEAELPWATLALSYGSKIVAAAAGGWLATRSSLENTGEHSDIG